MALPRRLPWRATCPPSRSSVELNGLVPDGRILGTGPAPGEDACGAAKTGDGEEPPGAGGGGSGGGERFGTFDDGGGGTESGVGSLPNAAASAPVGEGPPPRRLDGSSSGRDEVARFLKPSKSGCEMGGIDESASAMPSSSASSLAV